MSTVTGDGAHNAFPSITETHDGRLLVIYRKGDKHPGLPGGINGKLAGKYSVDNGENWSPERVLIEENGRDITSGHVRLIKGILLCAVTSYDNSDPSSDRKAARVYRSFNNGASWAGPIIIPSSFTRYTDVCGPPCLSYSGDILLPFYAESVEDPAGRAWIATVRSLDVGKTWKDERIIHSGWGRQFGCYEPNMAQLTCGVLCCLMNNDDGSSILASFSNDNGRRWSVVQQAHGGQGKPHFIELPNGTLRCFYREEAARAALLMRESYDMGQTWSSGTLFSANRSVYADSVILNDGSQLLVYGIESPQLTLANIFCERLDV